MKNIILLILVVLPMYASPQAARAEATNNATESITALTPQLKLQYYAGACNASQVRNLLKTDKVFDINNTPITMTPVQVAVKRMIDVSNNDNLAMFDECLNTITAIMNDKRYDYREQKNRQETDLMYLLKQGTNVADKKLPLGRYDIAVKSVLEVLAKKEKFDIDYIIGTGHPRHMPSTALGAVALGGLPQTFCELLRRYPDIRLDLTKGANFYTPLMVSIHKNNFEIFKLLIGAGTDYYIEVEGFSGFPALELARQLNRTDMITYLEKRRSGQQPPQTCQKNNIGKSWSR